MLNAKAYVNCLSSGNWTPLHRAAGLGSNEAVKILLEHGANYNIENENKHNAIQSTNTPLNMNKDETVKIIVDHKNQREFFLNETANKINELNLLVRNVINLIIQYCYGFSEL